MPSNRTPEAAALITEIDEIISRHALLDHPFYRMWSEGNLPQPVLADYAKQYYAHVAAFPTYVSAVHARTADIAIRQMLLENLIDEERGDDNHPELWLRFAEGLGVERDDVLKAEQLESTRASVAAFREIVNRADSMEGLAALYVYESQVPEVARTKREGLKAFYGLDDTRAVAFFTVHEKADLIHRQVERDVLADKVSNDNRAAVLKAADAAARALWSFLDGIYEATIGELPAIA